MSGFFRLAIAAVLVADFSGIAQAQSRSSRVAAAPNEYYALYDGGAVDHEAERSGVVPPSESLTVMGLRVPR